MEKKVEVTQVQSRLKAVLYPQCPHFMMSGHQRSLFAKGSSLLFHFSIDQPYCPSVIMHASNIRLWGFSLSIKVRKQFWSCTLHRRYNGVKGDIKVSRSPSCARVKLPSHENFKSLWFDLVPLHWGRDFERDREERILRICPEWALRGSQLPPHPDGGMYHWLVRHQVPKRESTTRLLTDLPNSASASLAC